jgi:hypothetical protein
VRKLVTLGAATASAAALAAGAHAGPAATDSEGNVSIVDIALSPPVASSLGRPVGATLTFHEFFGNRNGSLLPHVIKTTIRLPRGTRTNGRLFPKCDLPDNPDEVGKRRCSKRSRVGSGTLEVDARPALAQPLGGKLAAYNGELRDGRPTLILLATVVVGDSAVNGELDFQVRGSTLVSLPLPEGTPEGLFEITKVNAAIRASRVARRSGRRVRVNFVETPRICRRGTWRSSSTQAFEGGGSLTAFDTAACSPAR